MSLWTMAAAAERAARVAGAADRAGAGGCSLEVTRHRRGFVVAAVFLPNGDIAWATSHGDDIVSEEPHDGETFVFLGDAIKAELGE